MCIAILNTKGATLKKGILKNCWDNNGDGAGLLYINDDKQMMTFKEMKSFDAFYEEYGRVKKLYGSRNIVLHFRISTHGKVDETNCHPFLVSENLGFVHNGMIYSVPESKDYSDTYMFNESVLKYLGDGFEYNEVILDMMEGFINSSKLIFLNNEDHYAIVNEKAGHWSNQCWFSNTSYKQVNNYVDYGGVKKYKNDWGYGYGAGNIYGQSWGSSYEPYVYTREPKQVERDEEELLCYECGMHLYDKDEINFGTCNYCQMEQHEHLNDECEGCLGVGAKYNKEWKAMLCETCDKDLVLV